MFRLLRWSSGENVEAADAQPPPAPSDNVATTQAMEQLKVQLQEKDKALEELNGQVLDLEVSSSAVSCKYVDRLHLQHIVKCFYCYILLVSMYRISTNAV